MTVLLDTADPDVDIHTTEHLGGVADGLCLSVVCLPLDGLSLDGVCCKKSSEQ